VYSGCPLLITSLDLNIEGVHAGAFTVKIFIAVIFCPYMFFNFYVVKIHKIAKNPTTAGTRGKLSTHLEALKF
jgi:hypothetical protein